MMSLTPSECRNEILSALPSNEIAQVWPMLQPVTFVLEQVLHDGGNLIEEVYFPESGLVSLIADTHDKGFVEVGLIGREGIVGLPVLLNREPVAVHMAVVQIAGSALRMRAADFRAAVAKLPGLRDHCLRYVQFVLVQTAQMAACNARHNLPERLARWLLISCDRIDSNDVPVTQEFLSYMLGVRRSGVSVVANALHSSEVIRQSRGHITVLDRPALEAEACSCYRIIEESRRQIMGGPGLKRS